MHYDHLALSRSEGIGGIRVRSDILASIVGESNRHIEGSADYARGERAMTALLLDYDFVEFEIHRALAAMRQSLRPARQSAPVFVQ